jgi:hypothetical protein
MSQIFSRAATTVVWLGPEMEDSESAIRYINNLSMAEAGADTVRAKIADPALTALFSRSYWERMWVVQEFFLSKRLLIFAGSNSCWWQDLYKLPDIVYGTTAAARELEGVARTKGMSMILQKRWFNDGDKRYQRPSEVDQLIIFWQHQKCQDIRDKVFGLLGLVESLSDQWPAADYSKSVEEVYADVLYKFAQASIYQDEVKRFARELREVLQVNSYHPEVIVGFHKALALTTRQEHGAMAPVARIGR